MFCLKCGNQLPENAVFCPACGTKCTREQCQVEQKNQTQQMSSTSKFLILSLLGVAIITIAISLILFSQNQKLAELNASDKLENEVNSPISTIPNSVPSIPVDYNGQWEDEYGQRCHMSIEEAGGDAYFVQIFWANSSNSTTMWTMIANRNPETNELEYQNCIAKLLTNAETGIVTSEETLYRDGSGRFYYDGNYLYWQDSKEDAGAMCQFKKWEYDYNAVSTDFFSVSIPDDWLGRSISQISSYSVDFYEYQSYYDFNEEGGFLFGISLGLV